MGQTDRCEQCTAQPWAVVIVSSKQRIVRIFDLTIFYVSSHQTVSFQHICGCQRVGEPGSHPADMWLTISDLRSARRPIPNIHEPHPPPMGMASAHPTVFCVSDKDEEQQVEEEEGRGRGGDALVGQGAFAIAHGNRNRHGHRATRPDTSHGNLSPSLSPRNALRRGPLREGPRQLFGRAKGEGKGGSPCIAKAKAWPSLSHSLSLESPCRWFAFRIRVDRARVARKLTK